MKIIVVGCGRVGAGLAQTLMQSGHTITIIDINPAAFERLGRNFSGQTLTGVGFDREVLLAAGIERADGLAAVTSSDEANVVTAQVARQMFQVPKVVARLYDQKAADIYRHLGLQTIAPNAWGIQRMADLLSYSQIHTVATLGDGGVQMVELDVPSHLVGRRIPDIAIPGEVSVVALSRRGQTTLPSSDIRFESGDVVFLAVAATAVNRLHTMLGLR